MLPRLHIAAELPQKGWGYDKTANIDNCSKQRAQDGRGKPLAR